MKKYIIGWTLVLGILAIGPQSAFSNEIEGTNVDTNIVIIWTIKVRKGDNIFWVPYHGIEDLEALIQDGFQICRTKLRIFRKEKRMDDFLEKILTEVLSQTLTATTEGLLNKLFNQKD